MDKKFILISGLLVLMGGIFVYEKFIPSQQNTTVFINTKQTPTSGSVNTPIKTITPPPTPATTANPAVNSTGLKDGVYTGKTINSMYGPAQAQIIISGGQITNVQFLQYPSDRSTSLRKSQMAMPIIKQEVIGSQSANVNTVSGATETSSSFIQSISSALSQA